MRRRDAPSNDHNASSPMGPGGGGARSQWYTRHLNSDPIKTKAITLGIINFIGDLITQVTTSLKNLNEDIEVEEDGHLLRPLPRKSVQALASFNDFRELFIEKSGGVDFRRLAAMTSLGLFIVGPILHFWYGFLNRVVKVPGLKGVMIRLLLDQFILAPGFIALTFSYLLLLEGKFSGIQEKLSKDWKPTLFANWKLWVPFQFFNFMFVPPILQVLFSNCVGLVWNVYISYASHKPAGASTDKQLSRLETNILHVEQ